LEGTKLRYPPIPQHPQQVSKGNGGGG